MAPVTRTLTTIRDTAVGVYNGLDRGAAGNRASLGSLITSARDGINYLDNNFSLEGWGNAINQLRGIPVAPGAPSPVNVYNDIDNGLKAIDAWADRTDARILDYVGQAALFPDKIPSDIRAAYRSARDAVSGVYEAEGIPGLAERASYYGMRTAGEVTMAAIGTKGAGNVLRAERTAGAVAAESAGIQTANGVLFNGLTGPGPLSANVASTFRSGTFLQTVTNETTTLYRVFGGAAKEIGPYWTRTAPRGPVQSMIDSALDPSWGNNATRVVRIDVPRGTTIYEGAAARQRGLVGGGNQVFVPDANAAWIVR